VGHSQSTAETEVVAGRVVTELRERLFERGSVLASEHALDGGLEFQVRSIIAESISSLSEGVHPPAVSVEYGDGDVLSAHGERSAILDIDPSEPLMAAEVLYDVALPAIADAAAESRGSRRDLEVARALHHAIWRRFPPGAIAYVEVLRDKLQTSHREARLRLARELHDRVAHGIAAGVHRLEALSLQRTDPDLDPAIKVLRLALVDTQNIAVDLRAQVADSDLAEALEDYAYATGGRDTLPVHVTQIGTTRPLSALAREELFTIVMEATRNSRTHAEDATAVGVRLEWSPTRLLIAVSDDGRGYKPGAQNPGSLGLQGIAERAAAIGASVEFLTDSGATGIRLSMPFVGVGQS
jgi:signal transduction histidine kinase